MNPNDASSSLAIPSIDRAVPENLQTATFAFG
jgi:hypothetical protein